MFMSVCEYIYFYIILQNVKRISISFLFNINLFQDDPTNDIERRKKISKISKTERSDANKKVTKIESYSQKLIFNFRENYVIKNLSQA